MFDNSRDAVVFQCVGLRPCECQVYVCGYAALFVYAYCGVVICVQLGLYLCVVVCGCVICCPWLVVVFGCLGVFFQCWLKRLCSKT